MKTKKPTITFQLSVDPEETNLGKFLEQCRQLYLENMPYMDTSQMGRANAKTVEKHLTSIQDANLQTGEGVFPGMVNHPFNRLLAYTMGVNVVGDIPPVQRKAATKAMQFLTDRNLKTLKTLAKNNVDFLSRCQELSEAVPDKNNIPPGYIPKRDVLQTIKIITESRDETNKNTLNNILSEMAYRFLPHGTIRYKTLKKPMPKKAGIDPYRYITREYCDRTTLCLYAESIIDVIRETREWFL